MHGDVLEPIGDPPAVEAILQLPRSVVVHLGTAHRDQGTPGWCHRPPTRGPANREWIDPRPVTLRRGPGRRNDVVTGVGGKQILVEDPSGNPAELFEPTRPEAALACRA